MKPIGQPATVNIGGTVTIEKHADGSYRGEIFVNAQNTTLGFVQLRASNLDGLKFLQNILGQFIAAQSQLVVASSVPR